MNILMKFIAPTITVMVLGLAGCGDNSNQTSDESANINAADMKAAPPRSLAARNLDVLYSPTTAAKYPSRVYWGDTHLHSNFSMDAYTFGTTLGPDDAYRFAKGETVMATHGQPARLAQPLDFLVIADHSEGLGAMLELEKGNETLMANETLAGWKKLLSSADRATRRKLEGRQTIVGNPPELDAPEVRAPAWDYLTTLADEHYEPGTFTPLIGFEFSAQKNGQNLHRVVIYRDGAEKTKQILPLSSTPSGDPRVLWKYLENYETQTGGKVLAIPHNGNLSNGIMFPMAETEFGAEMDSDYVSARARWEPLYETTQIKGDGETHPFLSVDDEFANFETWALGDFAGVPKTNDMLAAEYTRSALKRGLELEAKFGANPYKFGLIGSTDAHTGLSAVSEDNFFGKHSADMEPSPTRWKDAVGGRGDFIVPGWMMASSGYAAVWARDNTREEIWDAMARREVYATTGPRMTLRFFGGWDFTQNDVYAPDLAAIGYENGVPMGSDLKGADLKAGRSGKAPSFLIGALKDANGANLDRVQIIKGWLDAGGVTQEKVYDVVWSDAGNRQIGADGKLPAVGSSVDLQKASYDNSIGANTLSIVWVDPDFDPKQASFYYVRVLEIPTPRWTAYDSAVFGSKMPAHIPMVIQERAYSSPIWYNPTSEK